MSVFTRHPRYVFLLLSILLICSFLLFPSHSSSLARDGYLSSKSLQRVLREEDALYSDALVARENLVKKWGPTAKDVVSYVDLSYQLE